MKGKKGLHCSVTMLDETIFTCSLQSQAVGEALYAEVLQSMQMFETDYFGLEYTHQDGFKTWLDREKCIHKQCLPNQDTYEFEFHVKFYTPDPTHLEDEFTRYQFALQVKQDLARGRLLCNFNTKALLVAYIAQAELGDQYTLQEEGLGASSQGAQPSASYLQGMAYVPDESEELNMKIMEFHGTMRGISPADADASLLDTARKTDLYGIVFHPARDHEGVDLDLAVVDSGILVFQNNQRINTFSWAKIRKLSFKRIKFIVKLQPSEDHGYHKNMVAFHMSTRNESKHFWKVCVEHHSFFRATSAPATIPRPRRRRVSFQRGSSFRYTGRTQKQLLDHVKDNFVKPTRFERTLSSRASSRRQLAASSASTTLTSHHRAMGGSMEAGSSLSSGSHMIASTSLASAHTTTGAVYAGGGTEGPRASMTSFGSPGITVHREAQPLHHPPPFTSSSSPAFVADSDPEAPVSATPTDGLQADLPPYIPPSPPPAADQSDAVVKNANDNEVGDDKSSSLEGVLASLGELQRWEPPCGSSSPVTTHPLSSEPPAIPPAVASFDEASFTTNLKPVNNGQGVSVGQHSTISSNGGQGNASPAMFPSYPIGADYQCIPNRAVVNEYAGVTGHSCHEAGDTPPTLPERDALVGNYAVMLAGEGDTDSDASTSSASSSSSKCSSSSSSSRPGPRPYRAQFGLASSRSLSPKRNQHTASDGDSLEPPPYDDLVSEGQLTSSNEEPSALSQFNQSHRRMPDPCADGPPNPKDDSLSVHLQDLAEMIGNWSVPGAEPLSAATNGSQLAEDAATARPPVHPKAASALGKVRPLEADDEMLAECERASQRGTLRSSRSVDEQMADMIEVGEIAARVMESDVFDLPGIAKDPTHIITEARQAVKREMTTRALSLSSDHEGQEAGPVLSPVPPLGTPLEPPSGQGFHMTADVARELQSLDAFVLSQVAPSAASPRGADGVDPDGAPPVLPPRIGRSRSGSQATTPVDPAAPELPPKVYQYRERHDSMPEQEGTRSALAKLPSSTHNPSFPLSPRSPHTQPMFSVKMADNQGSPVTEQAPAPSTTVSSNGAHGPSHPAVFGRPPFPTFTEGDDDSGDFRGPSALRGGRLDRLDESGGGGLPTSRPECYSVSSDTSTATSSTEGMHVFADDSSFYEPTDGLQDSGSALGLGVGGDFGHGNAHRTFGEPVPHRLQMDSTATAPAPKRSPLGDPPPDLPPRIRTKSTSKDSGTPVSLGAGMSPWATGPNGRGAGAQPNTPIHPGLISASGGVSSPGEVYGRGVGHSNGGKSAPNGVTTLGGSGGTPMADRSFQALVSANWKEQSSDTEEDEDTSDDNGGDSSEEDEEAIRNSLSAVTDFFCNPYADS